MKIAQMIFALGLSVLALGSTASPSVSTNACSPIGPQRIAVILATYPGAPADSAIPDVGYVQSLFTGTDEGFSVADYFKTVSNGKAWFQSVKVVGPYVSTTPFIRENNDADEADAYYQSLADWESHVVTLAAGDLDLMNIDRIVFITPEALDSRTKQPVPYGSGMSSVGVCDLKYTGPSGQRNFAPSYIFASPFYHGIDISNFGSPDILKNLGPDGLKRSIKHRMADDMAIIAHELGHSFGLDHAHSVSRPTSDVPYNHSAVNDETLPGIDQMLYVNEYGDPLDVMTNDNLRWLNVPHLAQLGWLETPQVQKVTSNGTFRIYPLEQTFLDGAKLRGIQIPRALQSPDEKTEAYLWVEYRQGGSPYEFYSTMQVDSATEDYYSYDGALVHYTDPAQLMSNDAYFGGPQATFLLNFTPSGPIPAYQKDLTLKGIWKDPHSMVRLQVIQVTPDYLDIQVSFEK